MSKHDASILVVDDGEKSCGPCAACSAPTAIRCSQQAVVKRPLRSLQSIDPDLVLLDLLLPGMSGLEVCRRVRATSNVPIIVLSVKDTERDKVEALDLGADDYVAKPFGLEEVLARVRVALRRTVQPPSDTETRFRAGPLSVDFALRQVLVEGREVKLTPTEFDLLKAFITRRGKILTRHMLLQTVWGDNAHARTHSLHVYVAQLRQKIEPAPERPLFILTIPGVGYRFNDEIEPS